MSLAGRVVFITGGSRGLGLAVARLCAQAGARLVLTARGREPLHAVARELASRTDVIALAGDVADPAHLQSLVSAALERFGRIDVLINNASVLGPSPQPLLEHYPLGVLEYVFRVNVLAPLDLVQRILPHMRESGHGVIVNVTSDAGVEAYPGWGGYGASKAALELQTRVLVAELASSSIRVYLVDPGDMNTRMHEEAEPGVDLSHLPSPDAVAPALVRLIEDEPVGMTRVRAQELVALR